MKKFIKIFTCFVIYFLLFIFIPVGNSDNFSLETTPGDDWWYHWIGDKNRNGIDDLIDRKTENRVDNKVNIFVDYRHRPTQKDIEVLNKLNLNISYVCKYINTICVRDVPLKTIPIISKLPNVVMIEKQGALIPLLDVSCRAIKARQSNEYSPNTAWDLGYTGEGAVIAVLDTGVDDLQHESLRGQFIAGVDTTDIGAGTPKDGDWNPRDTYGHGTFVAGIALGKDSIYTGVAPDAKLIDVKIYRTLEAHYEEHEEDAIEGFEWCIDHKDTDWSRKLWNHGLSSDYKGIDVITLSVGVYNTTADGNDAWSRVMNKAVEEGIVVVYAIGNTGPNNKGLLIPCPDKAIGVGATDDKNTIDREDDDIANWGEYGGPSQGPRDSDGDDDPYDELKPDIVAPGTDIMAPVPRTQRQFYGVNGTSFSTPHVAGVCALMLQANPNLTPEQIKQILHTTAEKRGNASFPHLEPKYNRSYGWGIVDAYKAVATAAGLSLEEEINLSINCYITFPKDDDNVSGVITVTGTCVARNTSITKVEVRIDNGKWLDAKLSEWRWSYNWDTITVKNGKHTIYARAVADDTPSGPDLVNVYVSNFGTPTKQPPTVAGLPVLYVFAVLGILIVGGIGARIWKKKRVKRFQ